MAVTNSSNSTNASPLGWGTTLGTTSGPAFPGNASCGGMMIVNTSTAATISLCTAQTNVGTLGVYSGFAAGVAVINGPGCITLAPGDKFIIDNLLCTTAWNGVASAPGGTVTFFTF